MKQGTFSGIVKIADISDYITPSQNCNLIFVNWLFKTKII